MADPTINPEAEYTVQEAGKILGMSYWSVMRLRKAGRITFTGARGGYVTTGAEILRFRDSKGTIKSRGEIIRELIVRIENLERRIAALENPLT